MVGANEWQFKDLNRRQDEVVKISKGPVVSSDILPNSRWLNMHSGFFVYRRFGSLCNLMQVMPMPDIAVNPRLWQKAQLGSWVSHGIQDADLGLSFPYTLRFQFLDVTRSGVAERTLNERYLWCHFRNRADGAETY
jgi:hypothetical protein